MRQTTRIMGKTYADIGAFSFSHQNTTLEERDQLAFSTAEITDAIPQFRDLLGGEVGILSTCNRTEIYAYTDRARNLWPTIRDHLSQFKSLSSRALPEPIQLHSLDAAQHLFRVACSLESLALGEDQILAQVKSAHELILRDEHKSPVLDQLFQFAVRTGKQVRTDTTLCQGTVSISSVSVELARKIFGNFKRATVLLVGAGETAMNAAIHFRGAGCKNFIVVNRGEERGRNTANELGGEYMPLHRLSDACVRADIAVFATGSKTHLVDRETIRNIMRARRNRQFFMIDISNPRNVAPEVDQQDGVFLFNIDHLEKIVAEHLKGRADQIPQAESIIKDYMSRWDEWMRSRRVTPTISALAKHFASVRTQELEAFRNRVSEDEFALLEELSRKLVKKLQHNPIMFMKNSAANGSLRSEDLNLIVALHNLDQKDK